MQRIILSVTVTLLAAATVPASAADVGPALKKFGLDGIYSSDCARPLRAGGTSVRYDISPKGEAKIVSFFAKPPGTPAPANTRQIYDYAYELTVTVIEATLQGPDKLRLIVSSSDGKKQETVLQRVGDQVRPWRAAAGGKTVIEDGKILATGRDVAYSRRCTPAEVLTGKWVEFHPDGAALAQFSTTAMALGSMDRAGRVTESKSWAATYRDLGEGSFSVDLKGGDRVIVVMTDPDGLILDFPGQHSHRMTRAP